jgi:hypothetical protein
MENNKYGFLTQMVIEMVNSIDVEALQVNIMRLAAFDLNGTSTAPQLEPCDPEFMTFYLFYLLLARITRFRIQQLTVENPQTAAQLVKKLTLLCNVLKDGAEPFSVTDFCSSLTEGLLPGDSYSCSGGFSGDQVNLQIPVDKFDFFIKLFPDVLYGAVTDKKVKTLPDMCHAAIDALGDTIKNFRQPPVPDRPTIVQRGDHLEFPI